MLTVKPTIINSMTLVMAMHNNKAIAVSADSLRIHDGVTLYDAKKLYDITSNSVILIAGRNFDSGEVNTFINDFAYIVNDKGLVNIDDIEQEFNKMLINKMVVDGPPNSTVRLVFLLAGFNDLVPKLFSFDSKYNFKNTNWDSSCLAAGKDTFAYASYREFHVSQDTNTEKLELAAYKIMYTASGEYPNEINGNITVRILLPHT